MSIHSINFVSFCSHTCIYNTSAVITPLYKKAQFVKDTQFQIFHILTMAPVPSRVCVQRSHTNMSFGAWIAIEGNLYVGSKLNLYSRGMAPNSLFDPFPIFYTLQFTPLDTKLEVYEKYVRNSKLLMGILKNLKIKFMGCFCPLGKPCHVDRLIKIIREQNQRYTIIFNYIIFF